MKGEDNIMAKKWAYAKLAQVAKEHGGPELYVKTIEKYGFQKGVAVMIPVCIVCVVAYAKGPKIIEFCKDKLKLVSKNEVNIAEEMLVTGIKQAEKISKAESENEEQVRR
jgi:hypothetical protein